MATNVETAFIKTAAKIYDNILSGVYDPTNEVKCRPPVPFDSSGVFHAGGAGWKQPSVDDKNASWKLVKRRPPSLLVPQTRNVRRLSLAFNSPIAIICASDT